MVDDKLVVKRRLVRVDRLWMELDFRVLSEQLGWPMEYIYTYELRLGSRPFIGYNMHTVLSCENSITHSTPPPSLPQLNVGSKFVSFTSYSDSKT